jgi:uncharacterized protein (DUF58 family)
MINKRIQLIGLGVLALTLIGIAVPTARTATTATLTASVVDQQCQGGDFVNVTLTATIDPPQQGVRFVWDFNNDGVFDTQPSTNPTVSTLYPDEVTVTAKVGAIKNGRLRATDTVTFGTLRCEG